MRFGKKEGVVFLIFLLILIILPTFIKSSTSESYTNTEWRMKGRYLNHTSYYNNTVSVNNIIWNFTPGNTYTSQPTIANDMVYFTMADGYMEVLFVLNATNGTQIWNVSFSTSGGASYSTPAIASDMVYVTSNNDRRIFAFNATNGTQIWNQTVIGEIDTSPIVWNDMLYIGEWGGGTYAFYAFNATNGTQIWNDSNFVAAICIHTTPAINKDIVYFRRDGDRVFALNATNGTQIWNSSTILAANSVSGRTSGPVYTNDFIYIGGGTGIAGYFYAFNATNGTMIWNFTSGGNIQSTPAVANGMVYFGGNDNTVFALNATNGTQIWNFTNYNDFVVSPIVLGDIVYIAETSRALHLLNATNGKPINSISYATFSDTNNFGELSVANDIVYMTTDKGIFALNESPIENHVCSNIKRCEYLNITSALKNENNTGNIIYLLDNNTIYSVDKATSFVNVSINITNQNIIVDLNGSRLNMTLSNPVLYVGNSENITIKNGYFISPSSAISISTTNKNITLLNNTFYSQTSPLTLNDITKMDIINNTFNETGNQTTGFFMSYSPFVYNNGTATINFNTCVRMLSGASAFQTITKDNTRMTDPDGIVHYRLWLYQDDASPILGCNNYANVTLWIASDYAAYTCDSNEKNRGGKCYYNNTYAFEAKGATSNYIWNSSIINSTLYVIGANTTPPTLQYNGYFFQTGFPINLQGATNINITGNKFYNINTNMTAINSNPKSKNNTLWYNNFYASGINGTLNNMTGCYSNKGNFYDYRIPYSSMPNGECGLINITSPSSQSTGNPITITWTAQSSYNTITYVVEYVLNNVRTRIGTTTGLSYVWNAPYAAGQNYTINIVPQGSNGTNRNSTVVVKTPEQTETPSSMPSGGGEARDTTLPEGTSLLESVQGFTTDVNEAALNIIVNEVKTQEIKLTNPTQYNLIIKVILDKNLADIIKPSENYFILKSGETKDITFDILAKEPGEYKGIIKLVSDEYQRTIEVNIIAKAGQITDISKPLIIDKITLKERIISFFIWIGKIIMSLVNWFKALF